MVLLTDRHLRPLHVPLHDSHEMRRLGQSYGVLDTILADVRRGGIAGFPHLLHDR